MTLSFHSNNCLIKSLTIKPSSFIMKNTMSNQHHPQQIWPNTLIHVTDLQNGTLLPLHLVSFQPLVPETNSPNHFPQLHRLMKSFVINIVICLVIQLTNASNFLLTFVLANRLPITLHFHLPPLFKILGSGASHHFAANIFNLSLHQPYEVPDDIHPWKEST